MLGLSGARAVVFGIALLSAVAAYMLMGRGPAPAPVTVVQEAAPARTVEILVAASDLPLGNTIVQSDVRWQSWPQDSVPTGLIRKEEAAILDKEVIGALVRSSFIASEPIRREKLIKPDGSGFLAAVLPAGKRAIAMSIDRAGNSTAGGFILPNDRVDIIKTGRQDPTQNSAENFSSETILTNIKVLAIGQNIQERNGEKVVVGETATLELDPRQVETVTLAQKSGALSLALRSLADAKDAPPPEAISERQGLTLVRFGVTSQSAKQ
ncbi:MAG: Flp pilus assembly protein CpaB [Bosea sp. (in: a-proteobacteria)]